jgi:hypothetical protein
LFFPLAPGTGAKAPDANWGQGKALPPGRGRG